MSLHGVPYAKEPSLNPFRDPFQTTRTLERRYLRVRDLETQTTLN